MIGRFPGLSMTGFFSALPVFLEPPVTHTVLPPFPLTFPNPSVSPPEIDKGDDEEEDEEEDGGLAMDNIPCIASRVLGEAGASALKEELSLTVSQN